MGAERLDYVLRLLGEMRGEVTRDVYYLTRDDQDYLTRLLDELKAELERIYRGRGVRRDG